MNKKGVNIVGTKIGIYDILYECDFKSKDKHRLFHIRCSECGWETNIQFRFIKRLSQVCRHKNLVGQYFLDKKKIKWKDKRLYSIYQNMIQRCYNPRKQDFQWYGAKGIKICQEWIDNPLKFEEWSLQNGYKKDLTIDRIDASKDYCPENCRWVSNYENSKYKSTTRILEVDGIKHTGREWSEILNVGTNVINSMLRIYPEEKVKIFIRLRLQDPTGLRKSKQSWMDAYNLQ